LDAKGVPHSRITARHAAKLLAEASQKGGASQKATTDGKRGKTSSAKNAAALGVDSTPQPLAAPH
jgi:topoisomerase IA-like protein